MNKAQKITIALALIIMSLILIYPPTVGIEGLGILVPEGRNFIFSFPLDTGKEYFGIQIDTKRLTAELLVIVCLGGAFTIIFGLKKKY